MDEIQVTEYINAMKNMIELAPHHAGAIRAYFEVLVKEGFNELQALEIVKRHGYQPPLHLGGGGEE